MFTGIERIDAKIHTIPECGCWIWEGCINSRGYGMVKLAGVMQYLHHILWRMHHKRPIPKGMVLMHRCDTRRCCNPLHLRPGTHNANMRDMVRKGRQATNENGRLRGAAQRIGYQLHVEELV